MATQPYSQAISAPPFLFLSGCIPLDPSTGEIIQGGVEEQTRQALKNLKEVVIAGGSELAKVVKTTVRSRHVLQSNLITPINFKGIPAEHG